MSQLVQIKNHTRPLADQIVVAYCESFLCKLRGLTLRKNLPRESGLLLVEERDSRVNAAIHMLGVFFDLGIVWINADHKVVDCHKARAWFSVLIPSQPACFVLEIAPERLEEFQIGDEVSFENIAAT